MGFSVGTLGESRFGDWWFSPSDHGRLALAGRGMATAFDPSDDSIAVIHFLRRSSDYGSASRIATLDDSSGFTLGHSPCRVFTLDDSSGLAIGDRS